ncbi:hypothetical protein [Sphingomonas glaciei]|uniref:Uncharacterized protein n=1 Tax=Sphingomonas glaciei TaxID=2938948 RepID=A0ABY5MQD9_9SPHN|nr:hypothetical protein [Sphingomonas glaciei]UUR06733.1 hypothetical protein M1K48_07120 [Sphingomonas glaciei]
MPCYYTRLINAVADSIDDGVEFKSVEEATSAAVFASLDFAKELLKSGESLPHIEVVISDEVRVVARRLVTVSIANLEA